LSNIELDRQKRFVKRSEY